MVAEEEEWRDYSRQRVESHPGITGPDGRLGPAPTYPPPETVRAEMGGDCVKMCVFC